MSLPALGALKKKYPDLRVDWLVEEGLADLLADHPLINRVLISPRRELGRLARARRFPALIRTALRFIFKELRMVRYETGLDLQGLLKSGLFLWLSRAVRRVGFSGSREPTWIFLNERMPACDPERQAARRYLDAAVHLGAAYPDPEPRRYYDPGEQARRRAADLLGNCASRPYIVLNPGAKWETKRWPTAHWRSLAGRIRDLDRVNIVVTGGPEDEFSAEALFQAAPGVTFNLCGRTTLRELAAVLERATLVVTADTGPMHLAAAVGAVGLALFGPTRPGRTGPFGGDFTILTARAECLGCLKRRCDHFHCMADISPDEVFDHVRQRLSGRSSGHP